VDVLAPEEVDVKRRDFLRAVLAAGALGPSVLAIAPAPVGFPFVDHRCNAPTWLGLNVGDRVTVGHPAEPYEVVGVGFGRDLRATIDLVGLRATPARRMRLTT
jgi:hypothetical protein